MIIITTILWYLRPVVRLFHFDRKQIHHIYLFISEIKIFKYLLTTNLCLHLLFKQNLPVSVLSKNDTIYFYLDKTKYQKKQNFQM